MHTTLPHVAFLGLGVMGAPMARHLAHAGYPIRAYNRSPARCDQWWSSLDASVQSRAEVGSDLAWAVERAEFVMLCVGNDDDVRSVLLSEGGVFAHLRPGATVVDHTTASAELAQALGAIARSRGFGFLDAPVSGGQAGAEAGKLAIMVGGDAPIYAQAQAVLSVYAKVIAHIGPNGAGQQAKMVNQICIAGIVQGLAEALRFGANAGLDMEKVLGVISQGAAQSWQMNNRALTMLKDEFNFGFAVDWMRKDLALCLDEARRNGSSLPVAALVDQYYAEVQHLGGRRWDTSSLIARLPVTPHSKIG